MARRSTARKEPPETESGATLIGGDGRSWTAFADLILQRQALLFRIARGTPPDELAGLRIDDEHIDSLLVEITNASSETSEQIEATKAQLAPLIDTQRALLHTSLDEPHAFSILVANAGLDLDEAEVFAVLCSIELDARRQRLVAYVQDDVTRKRLTAGGLRRLFDAPHPGVLTIGPESALHRAALIEVEPTGPWASREISVATSVTWALVGDGSSDPELPVAAEMLDHGGSPSGDPLVFVVGEDRRRRLERATAATAGTRFLVTPMPVDEPEWRATVREATLRGVGIVLEAEAELPAPARTWIERATHLPWAVSTPLELRLQDLPRRRWVEIVAPHDPPSDDEWKLALGDAPRDHALTAEQLDMVELAFEPKGQDIDAAVRRLASGKIDALTRRVRPERTWDDIVIPPERLAHLRELVARYRHRSQVYDTWGFRADKSTGIIALFHGPSGTGKTLAAEIIAGDLGLDLFKLDLSAVVSKYIGETEKNLEEIFAAASAASGVLLFDEADSLFGKRGEVQDARDRYANMEVSYLLQRVESYDGIVILTTNFQKNIDTAFLRRIHVSLEFQIPDVDERRAIWESGFPADIPLDDVDVDFLARQFKLAGGSIHNVTVYAAFLAAASGERISMEHVIFALKREYQKLGRLRTREEFGEYTNLVQD
ncbi:MAG: AAA family ATPase [Acidimicrobiia bacterium]|nr:AAA family ATPase [Acidimicrobiia bacterium]